jgi:sugar phosphate isomerase/epimerase
MVQRSKRANAAVLIDALHFSRSGGTPGDVAQVDPALFRYVQVCDAVPDMPRDVDGLIREARTGRLLPGEGTLPLAALVAALPAGTPVSVEAPSRATAHLPAVERAKRAHESLRALLRDA